MKYFHCNIVMYQSIPNPPILTGHIPGIWLDFYFCSVGNLIQNEPLLVGHLTFVSKRWSALQAKGFRNFFRIQHVHRVHGSLLLYSLFCWNFWEPLKKPVKCGLSAMNNFIKMKKTSEDSFPRLKIFRLCLVGYLHLSKRFDTWKDLNGRWWVGSLMLFEPLASGAFDHLKCQHTREFFQKSHMPTGVPLVTGGMDGFETEWCIILNVFTTKSA